MIKKLFLFFSMVTLFIGCSASQPKEKSNLTFAVVKSNIKEGKTTQAEILHILGSPNITTKDSEGNEVWTYSRQSYDTETGSYYGTLIIFGGEKAFRSSASSTFDLILVFDKKDKVKKYSVVASQF